MRGMCASGCRCLRVMQVLSVVVLLSMVVTSGIPSASAGDGDDPFLPPPPGPPPWPASEPETEFIIHLVVKSDPAKHARFFMLPPQGKVRIKFVEPEGPADWGRVAAPDRKMILEFLSATLTGSNNQSYTAPVPVEGACSLSGSCRGTGKGTFAGYPGIGVEFAGQITSTLLIGEYRIGVKEAGNTLPGGQPIIFSIDGQRQLPSTSTPDSSSRTPLIELEKQIIQGFTGGLVQAWNGNDTDFLFSHLHPAVLEAYGAEQCQSHLAERGADPTFAIDILGINGPAPWEYVSDFGPVSIPNVYTVDANEVERGIDYRRSLHFGVGDGTAYWFTKCTVRPSDESEPSD